MRNSGDPQATRNCTTVRAREEIADVECRQVAVRMELTNWDSIVPFRGRMAVDGLGSVQQGVTLPMTQGVIAVLLSEEAMAEYIGKCNQQKPGILFDRGSANSLSLNYSLCWSSASRAAH